MPVAVEVPKFGGADSEARLSTSIRNQKPPPTSGSPVPQGLCITNSEGRVLEWTQLFDDEADVIDFLDRSFEAFEQDPLSPGEFAVPRKHDGDCIAGDPRAKGALAGRVFGRVVDKDGRLCPDTDVQQNYMQEDSFIDLATTKRLHASLDGGGLPDEVIESMLYEVHMGMKDVRFFNNPMRGTTDIRTLSFRVRSGAGGVYRLDGASDVSVRKKGLFEHDMKLAWEGYVVTDQAGIVSVTMVGNGEFDLWWRGFGEDGEAFKKLFAGRGIDQQSAVRFGVVFRRREAGPAEDPTPRGLPSRSFREKMNKLQERVETYRNDGGDMRALHEEMQAMQRFIREHNFEEAEKQLDKMLEMIEDQATLLPRRYGCYNQVAPCARRWP